MKIIRNKNKYIATAAAMTLCLLLVVCTSGTDADRNTGRSDVPERHRAPQTCTLPVVVSPDVPESVDLCGETIVLDRPDLRERFDREITSLVYGHSSTLLTLKRANKLFPVVEQILRDNGAPHDLVYLMCVESALNTTAKSSAGAAGLWQFMEGTAREYGLEVNDEVDERYNIEKSTAAAARYLKNARRRYGNWPSAMASYNAGPARINRELESQQQESALDLFLNDETSRYVFRIMAIKALMENPEAYGYRLREDQLYQPVLYNTLTVNGPVADWPQWALDHGTTYARLREANPWIRSKKLTNRARKEYTVKIPA